MTTALILNIVLAAAAFAGTIGLIVWSLATQRRDSRVMPEIRARQVRVVRHGWFRPRWDVATWAAGRMRSTEKRKPLVARRRSAIRPSSAGGRDVHIATKGRVGARTTASLPPPTSTPAGLDQAFR